MSEEEDEQKGAEDWGPAAEAICAFGKDVAGAVGAAGFFAGFLAFAFMTRASPAIAGDVAQALTAEALANGADVTPDASTLEALVAIARFSREQAAGAAT